MKTQITFIFLISILWACDLPKEHIAPVQKQDQDYIEQTNNNARGKGYKLLKKKEIYVNKVKKIIEVWRINCGVGMDWQNPGGNSAIADGNSVIVTVDNTCDHEVKDEDSGTIIKLPQGLKTYRSWTTEEGGYSTIETLKRGTKTKYVDGNPWNEGEITGFQCEEGNNSKCIITVEYYKKK